MKRLVIDASTLVSGITGPRSDSPPCLLFDAVSEMSIEAIVCPRLLGEIERALRKPYFRSRIEDEEIDAAVSIIRAAGTMTDDPSDPPAVLRDPTDDYLVMLAREAGAEAIVTQRPRSARSRRARSPGDRPPSGLQTARAGRRIAPPRRGGLPGSQTSSSA